MRIVLAIIGLGVCLTGQGALGKDQSPRQSQPAKEVSPQIKSIATSWENRRRQLPAGELAWRLQRQLRSGSYPTLKPGETRTARPADPVRVRFTPDGLRLDGICGPAMQFGGAALPDNAGWAAGSTSRQFQVALTAEFSEQKLRGLAPRFYAITVDRGSETHFWTTLGRETPCVVITPVGTAGPLFCYDAAKAERLPWMWGLIEGMRLSLRPDYLFDAAALASKGKLLPVQPLVGDVRCLALECPLDKVTDECVASLWIDPSRDNLVVRAVFRGKARALITQYDITYDQDERGRWLPARITTLQFNGHGDPFDELVSIREKVQIESKPSGEFPAIKPTAGTLVVDRITGEQYRVAADGNRKSVPLPETVAEIYADSNTARPTASRSRWSEWGQSVAYSLVSWPGILAILAAIFVGRLARKAVLRRRHATNSQAVLKKYLASKPPGQLDPPHFADPATPAGPGL